MKTKSESIPVTVSLAAFWTRIEDLQLIQFNPRGTGFFFKNAGEAESRGVELQMDITPATWLRLDAAGGYTDATFRDAPDPALGVRYDGNRLPSVPQWSWHAGATIEVPLTETAFITARTDISGRSDTFWDEANTVETKGCSIVNARIGIEHTNWGLHVFARILFDREVADVVYAFPGSAPIAEPADPQTAGVEFNLYF
jgi:outer membrane receptor protein involved in Fe transport